jgi:hypothetical protein
MLMNRIMGAFTFKREVYADVEKDASFTPTAWALVAVTALLTQLGNYAQVSTGAMDTQTWLISAVIGVAIALAAFAASAFVIAWLGKALFKADVSFQEMVRTLGLASVWGLLGIVGAVGAFVPMLLCALSPLLILAGILGFVSWLIAAKEALDLDWAQTAITVIAGWVVTWVITAVVGGAIAVAVGGGAALLGS